MAAAASTVCPLLIAATLLGLCSLTNVVHGDLIQSSCSAQLPVTFTQQTTGDSCTVNNQTNADIQQCVSNCRNLSFSLGILSSSNQCNCSNDTAFNLNSCCSDIQCDIACGIAGQQCNQATHQCEFTVPLPLPSNNTCNALCTGAGYQSSVSTGSNCTCQVCNGILNASPTTCARVSSALFGVSATLSGNGTCVVTTAASINATDVCGLVNGLNLPQIG